MSYIIFVPTEKEAAAIFGSADFADDGGFRCLKHKDLKIIIAGLGKANSAITFTRYLCGGRFNQSTPVLMGICGAYRNAGLKIGDICMVGNDHFVDEALYIDNSITCTHEMGFPVCKDNKVTFDTPFNLSVFDANTVSMLSGTDGLADLYRTKTGAAVESMEGAAFGLAAQAFNIKAVQVRAVSNYCGNRANQEWDIKKAFNALAAFAKSQFSVK